MPKAFSVLAGLLMAVAGIRTTRAESTSEFCVQVSAIVQVAPPEILLSWPQDSCTRPSNYSIFRKAPGSSSWGTGTILPGTSTNYKDTNVTVGTGYEYQIVKATSKYTGYGYIYAGINIPFTENRGKLLLVIDGTCAASLSNELAVLRQDMIGDGWTVVRLDVSRNDSVHHVKNLIKAQYNSDPEHVKAVFLFGHIPVPYSGDIVPDGHAPEHQGAWPCDGFYGDMDGAWTDTMVNDTSASEVRTRNVPGDGKFDQSTFPAPIKLMVGRVDLSNLPGRLSWDGAATFPDEIELLRNYLKKDHNFRTRQFDLPRRGFVGDYFGVRDGEAFAASGWRNFSSFFGPANITTLPDKGTWIPTLKTNTSLWAYGCGAGSFTSIGGLGNSDSYNDGTTTELFRNDIKAAFVLLFGSWLGDWDAEDDIMRSVLALPSYGLTCAWSGRPHWFLQHMALGEVIGYSARLTQNNGSGGLYHNQLNSCAGQTHIALMGDPTLRMHVVSPPTNLAGTTNSTGFSLGWSASSDTVLGYHIYSATDSSGPFTRLTQCPITNTTFTDATSGGSSYMVRAVKLETSASGTYYNLSQGAFLNQPLALPASTIVSSATNIPVTTPGTNIPTSIVSKSLTPTGPTLTAWVDDGLPKDAVPGSDGGDSWNWVSSNPAPFSGALANQSSSAAGLHQHYFWAATATLSVSTGDVLSAYVYLDPNDMPSEVMLQWNDGSWEHRAYWGANKITGYGMNDTSSRRYMGPLPQAGQWVLLQVPASEVALEGGVLNGMAFTLYDGRATWDKAGKSSGSMAGSLPSGTTSSIPTTNNSLASSVLWVDDSLPGGAVPGTDGGDTWNWISSNPAPVSGLLENQSVTASGLHQHYFWAATSKLIVNTGDVLFAYVYLDPGHMPSEVMLQWNDGSWEHRAYWGANKVTYGITGTTSRTYMGALPAAGQWTRLEVPATQVALEGSTLNGMAFTLYDGSATWDAAGKASVSQTNPVPIVTNTNNSPVTSTSSPPTATNTAPIVQTNSPPATTDTTTIVSTNSPGTNHPPLVSTNALPGVNLIDYTMLALPQIGSNMLHVLTPTLLELKLINTKLADPARVGQWDLVNTSGQFIAPANAAFSVTANGQPVSVTTVGFKRRPLYAPVETYDLRIENSLYLQLATPLSDNQVIEVKNPDGSLWSSSMSFIAAVDPLRYSPAIHVNQEGYMPGFAKKAMVGYYAGTVGELTVPSTSGFKLVDAATGAQVFQGTLVQRPDVGYAYSNTPYQNVFEADFTAFNTPGEYRLVVPGMGGSLPFTIDTGIGMNFARAYALGLYHQRCGTNTAMPFTRFTHGICHQAPANVPLPSSSYGFTWNTIAGYGNSINPSQTAPALNSPSAQLFPFITQGAFDVSGGHHDAGDYSKYTINSASLIHYLIFAVDSLTGVAALDNLGIPESGDGISDVMQEAKWEADFLAKMQDADGGFYFLVYPQNREYEGNVTPDHGDPQVVWPKTTSVTAASVAALAQCASSPLFKQTYPAAAALYLQKAQLGWQFLTNAIAKYGKNGAYQKLTHYGDNFADNDEMAWAACQIFLATGDQTAHQRLLSWFDPSDSSTWRWGWWRMSECYGHTIRSYGFALQSGRVTSTNQLNATFLSKCQAQIVAAGDDAMNWSQQSSYGTSFPPATKAVRGGGWYFSCDQAFDIAVAYQLSPKSSYMTALLANMNYEGGCNSINLSYITGVGWKRQRDIVSQWAANDSRVLPPSGIPVGNVTANFGYLGLYANELEELCFPSDDATVNPYPYYDRWGDSWNVTAEMVVLNQARGLGTLAFIAAQTSLKNQLWKSAAGQIAVPNGVAAVGSPVTVSLQGLGLDLSGARITWEARDQEPEFGPSFTFSPKNNGTQWVEAEAQLADGRRVFAVTNFSANSPNIVWVDDAIPAGASASADGGDSWNWITSNPAPFSGATAHQSSLAAGSHQHFFDNATATLSIGTGDVLYAYVYLDPANPPSEVMLQWNNGTWEHRAYWGANSIGYGTDGTPTRHYMGPLPPLGQWVQLKVPASLVNVEGSSLKGMAFTLYNGRATWDAAGRLAPSAVAVSVTATAAFASRIDLKPGVFTLTRSGDPTSAMTVGYALSGTAANEVDYQLLPANGLPTSVVFAPGETQVTLTIVPMTTTNFIGPQIVVLTLASNATYALANPQSATISLGGNGVPVDSLSVNDAGATLRWSSISNRNYRIGYKNNLTDPAWTVTGGVFSTNSVTSFIDISARGVRQRFYLVAQTD